ncbi:MAG TPA: YraN family protein [Caldisericia bacterium]|nr:MAG: hypothetical protein BWX90_00438 [bacterium ADurb.Bin132]HNY61912.1 YraN family protein [Caldisericia bacterium]HOC80001.1 YraN family protein [Caldisericia bacterium]HOG70848.1 YraN family protein [Caldisericia bacterium]HPA66238.1 YraN family protein [Caldisericia bacterium]
MSRSSALGKKGEEMAASLLASKGFEIVCKNYKTKHGEIDIICKKGADLLFVEVKRRSGDSFGTPLESLPAKRVKRMADAAMAFLSENPEFQESQIQLALVGISDGKTCIVSVDCNI